MMLGKTLIGAAGAAAFASAAPAQAQTAKDFDELRHEIESKDAVVLGDIGGGFGLPGSETSVRFMAKPKCMPSTT